MTEQRLPLVGKGVPKEAIEAAKSYVFGYINSGYQEDFLVLDSHLLSITNAGAGEEHTLLNLEYAYFSISTENVLNLNFYEYEFKSEQISFYESELISGGKSGRLSCHPSAGELEPFSWGDTASEPLIKYYRDNIDNSHFENRLLDIIEDDSSLYDAIFSFADQHIFDDIRDFFQAATKTLFELKSHTLNQDADSEWWSDIYELDATNTSMFARVLELRLGRLDKQIKLVESATLVEKKFLLEGSDILLQYNGEKTRFISQPQGPCLVFELVNSPEINPYSIWSSYKIVNILKEQGSTTIPLKGIFADQESENVYLITDITKVDAEKLVDATASKIGLWFNIGDEVKVLNRYNHYSFDRFSHV